MFDIDFNHPGPQVICHPQYQELIPRLLENLSPYHLHNHFILFSSGTTGGDLKGYAISYTALLANARAVNEHFHLTSSDVWGLSLPIYHIGGLSVIARAHLLGNKIVDGRSWDPEEWLKKMQEVTITTVVPTQLYDLLQKKLSAPLGLKFLVVGGDLLSSALKAQALQLGWPVIRTFGMSEVSSQLASCSTPQSDELQVLPIHQLRTKDENLLVKSESLFTLEFTMGDSFHVKMAQELCDQDGFYITKDRVDLSHGFKHLGRLGEEFKIAGHLINLIQLRDRLSSFLLEKDLFNQMELSVEDDERKGKKLVILSTIALDVMLQHEISNLLLPAKIEEFRLIQNFARTALGKLKKS